MGIGAILTIAGPLLATLIPALMHKSANGSAGFFDTIKGLFGNIFGSRQTTAVGAAGSLTLAGVMSAFGCKVSLSDYQTWIPALLPLVLGALMPQSAPKAPASPPQ